MKFVGSKIVTSRLLMLVLLAIYRKIEADCIKESESDCECNKVNPFDFCNLLFNDSIISISMSELKLPILHLNKNLLQYYPNLKKFHCFKCGITSITDDAFSRNKKLELLDLSNNKITELRTSSFRDNISLKQLKVDLNNIKYIESDFFDNLKQLEFLDLSSNQVECFNFQTLDNLKNLYVYDNPSFKCRIALKKFAEDKNIKNFLDDSIPNNYTEDTIIL